MTSAPAADVLEMTAVVGFGPRIRVLALRLEREQPRDLPPGREPMVLHRDRVSMSWPRDDPVPVLVWFVTNGCGDRRGTA